MLSILILTMNLIKLEYLIERNLYESNNMPLFWIA